MNGAWLEGYGPCKAAANAALTDLERAKNGRSSLSHGHVDPNPGTDDKTTRQTRRNDGPTRSDDVSIKDQHTRSDDPVTKHVAKT